MALISLISGSLELPLRPVYIRRIHGDSAGLELETVDGVPFQLISKHKMIKRVKGGVDRQELLQQLNIAPMSTVECPSFSVAAVAETEFGWCLPQFGFEGRLLSVAELAFFGEGTEARFDTIYKQLVSEMGIPTESAGWNDFATRFRWLFGSVVLACWTFDWGKVRLGRAAPDSDLFINVTWQT